MWECPICGHSNPEVLDFCENCGAARDRYLEENINEVLFKEEGFT